MRTAGGAGAAFALGLLHGPAELLPVSSSAHAALMGADVDQAMAVALHAGTALALLDRASTDPAVLVPAGLVTLAAAAALGDSAERRLTSRRAIAAGLVAGSAALVLADRAPQVRRRASWADGLALGMAQATALWPGVSRHGATLTVLRARGFDRAASARLSFGVGVPTLLGATLFKARGGRLGGRHAAAAAGAFASTLAARPLLDRAGPLWPFAAYRTGVALALLGRSVG